MNRNGCGKTIIIWLERERSGAEVAVNKAIFSRKKQADSRLNTHTINKLNLGFIGVEFPIPIFRVPFLSTFNLMSYYFVTSDKQQVATNGVACS